MKEDDLNDRFKRFAISVINFAQKLPEMSLRRFPHLNLYLWQDGVGEGVSPKLMEFF